MLAFRFRARTRVCRWIEPPCSIAGKGEVIAGRRGPSSGAFASRPCSRSKEGRGAGAGGAVTGRESLGTRIGAGSPKTTRRFVARHLRQRRVRGTTPFCSLDEVSPGAGCAHACERRLRVPSTTRGQAFGLIPPGRCCSFSNATAYAEEVVDLGGSGWSTLGPRAVRSRRWHRAGNPPDITHGIGLGQPRSTKASFHLRWAERLQAPTADDGAPHPPHPHLHWSAERREQRSSRHRRSLEGVRQG